MTDSLPLMAYSYVFALPLTRVVVATAAQDAIFASSFHVPGDYPSLMLTRRWDLESYPAAPDFAVETAATKSVFRVSSVLSAPRYYVLEFSLTDGL